MFFHGDSRFGEEWRCWFLPLLALLRLSPSAAGERVRSNSHPKSNKIPRRQLTYRAIYVGKSALLVYFVTAHSKPMSKLRSTVAPPPLTVVITPFEQA